MKKQKAAKSGAVVRRTDEQPPIKKDAVLIHLTPGVKREMSEFAAMIGVPLQDMLYLSFLDYKARYSKRLSFDSPSMQGKRVSNLAQ